jgi:L-aminopeptidase/D-esterase-like protein
MTGTTWLEETGFLRGPVMITNTYSVGVVRDAVVGWLVKQGLDWDWSLPIVAETWDATLNDINGFHVTKDDAFRALDSARSGPVAEGDVGGGTGMICHRFKGGIGTASRRFRIENTSYTLGVLVQCNYGTREQLHVAGVPVGREIPDQLPCLEGPGEPQGEERFPRCPGPGSRDPGPAGAEHGSIIVVVATDAPLLPHQLKRVAKRVALGVGRVGGIGGDSSGDIFVAFSTANAGAAAASGRPTATWVPNEEINPIFEATAQATEEAIINALVAAQTMTGANDVRVTALPHERLRAVLQKYNRLVK